MNQAELWQRFQDSFCVCESIGIRVDFSRMRFDEGFFDAMAPRIEQAMEDMAVLEAGGIANPDEGRMVGHYWLRSPELAPETSLTRAIDQTKVQIFDFASAVHDGRICSPQGNRFEDVLILGIGGSALGPQLLSDALGTCQDRMACLFCDNTDPDGYDRVLDSLDEDLGTTLVLVISKSGGTAETRNAMLEVRHRFEQQSLNFAGHAVAVTQEGSKLHGQSAAENWLANFPMWDWVGGRTSLTSAVGLLPAALQGLDVEGLLSGARDCDAITRDRTIRRNPAAVLALMWYAATEGRGVRDMVVIPYKDRLALFSRYLQQLVMESLGKERDLAGDIVHQGISVYGNKGSTDQHAYVQQLREGLDNFFATFIGVRQDRNSASMEVEQDVTSGDFLHGFLLGTRQALHEKGRSTLTIMLDRIDARSMGALVALYERAVGLYAGLININAYHQPGVEAGKKAAGSIIELQRSILVQLRESPGAFHTVEQLGSAIGAGADLESIFHILEHLVANPDRGVIRADGASRFEAGYAWRC